MFVDDAEIQKRLRYVNFTADDQRRIQTMADLVAKNVVELSQVFFDFLKPFHEARGLVGDPAVLDEALRLKQEHLLAMVKGDYGMPYVEQRLKLGRLYAKAGLETRVFLGAFHHQMRAIGFKVMQQGLVERFETFMSFKKVAFFDISLVVDTLIDEREKVIQQQQEAIRELSTPVLQVQDRLLLLPVVGVIDTQRALQMTGNLLQAVREHRARIVVLDITGVPAMDSKVADHLAQTIAAAGLMGAQTIITGLSADLAQALVQLGVDVSKLNTMGKLQEGMEAAQRLLAAEV